MQVKAKLSFNDDFKQIYDHDRVAGYLYRGKHIRLVQQRFFEFPEATIEVFDFTVCSAAIDHTGRVVCHRDFFEDLAAMRLSVQHLNYPLGTLERLVRYVEKGFRPDAASLLKLAKAIQEVDFTDQSQNKLRFYGASRPRTGRFDDEQADVLQFPLAHDVESANAEMELMTA